MYLTGTVIRTGFFAWAASAVLATNAPLLQVAQGDLEIIEKRQVVTYTTFDCVTASTYLGCLSSVSSSNPCPLSLRGEAALSCACVQASAEISCVSQFCSVPLVLSLYHSATDGCANVTPATGGGMTVATTTASSPSPTMTSSPSATAKANGGAMASPPFVSSTVFLTASVLFTATGLLAILL